MNHTKDTASLGGQSEKDASPRSKSKRKLPDWPKSPFRAATRPSVPVYVKVGISLPLWRTQMPMIHKIAANLNTPTADMMSFAAMAFFAKFRTKRELMAALREAQERYAVQGKPVELPFRMNWPDTSAGCSGARREREGTL